MTLFSFYFVQNSRIRLKLITNLTKGCAVGSSTYCRKLPLSIIITKQPLEKNLTEMRVGSRIRSRQCQGIRDHRTVFRSFVGLQKTRTNNTLRGKISATVKETDIRPLGEF